MSVIGLDVHRNFAQAAIPDEGLVKDHGRFAMDREAVLAIAQKVLTKEDDVAYWRRLATQPSSSSC